jgi:hypothetical protein
MNYKIINKNGNTDVILIHGLFATSGYWLKYLDFFKNSKLAILEIDYYDLKNFKDQIICLEKIIELEFNSKVDYIFSHSLGTIIANGVSENLFNFSFEICPVYFSKRMLESEFASDIVYKTNAKFDLDIIKKILYEIDIQILDYKKSLIPSKKRIPFLPNNDIYFNYNPQPIYSSNIFNGDHFEIYNAISKSLSFINNLSSK